MRRVFMFLPEMGLCMAVIGDDETHKQWVSGRGWLWPVVADTCLRGELSDGCLFCYKGFRNCLPCDEQDRLMVEAKLSELSAFGQENIRVIQFKVYSQTGKTLTERAEEARQHVAAVARK